MERDDPALELLRAQFAKIDAEREEGLRKIRRFDAFMKWSIGIIVVAMVLEPFIFLFARGLCK